MNVDEAEYAVCMYFDDLFKDYMDVIVESIGLMVEDNAEEESA